MKSFTLTLLILLTSTILSAKYTNCGFKNKNYEDICKKAVKNGVSYDYANKFLLSYFKTKKYDEASWKFLQPSKIKYHRKREKIANNSLVKFIPKMITNLKEYKEVYDYAEKKYFVNREIISAILLKETHLGEIKPKHDAFIVFNTMVVKTKTNTSRGRWILRLGKTNMVAIITHCYKKGVTPTECTLPSSYAGAVGIAQFMPDSFKYTEAYKNKTADLTKMEDAIVSTAKFLHLKAKFTQMINWSKMPDIIKIESQWYKYSFKNKNASFCYERTRDNKPYQCFTKGKPQLSYLKSYVKKIMHYNNSSNYAVGVLRLAYDAHKQINTK